MRMSEMLRIKAGQFEKAADWYGEKYGLTGKTPDELFTEVSNRRDFVSGVVAGTLATAESMVLEAEKQETEGN